ncbi:MAG: hypothetical protein Q7T51_04895 [Candidatus Moranbacteria bacterium]|nr:hypothetical protein [Candidatus Moranbacteria bacterium]
MAVFGALSFRTKFHRKFPKTFATLVVLGILSFGTVAAYKYIENKAQSQAILQDFGFANGINVVGFSRLDRPSGTFYSSGDILVGSNKKMRIKKNAIDSDKIKNKSIENEDISTGSVNSRIIVNGSIVGADISTETDLTINSLNVAELVSSEGIDMQGSIIKNIGDFGTDFTTSGGLNLAGNLSVNEQDLFVDIENGYVGIGTSNPIEKLTVDGRIAILEGGSSPEYYTVFRGGNQSEDITYTLPTESANGMLVNNNGVLEWDEDDYNHSHAGVDFEYEITSNSSPNAGTINVPANSATFYTDENRDDFMHVDLAAAPILTLVDDVQNFIVADRDTETFVVTTDEDVIDYVRYLPYAEAFKRSGSNAIHTQLAPMFGNGELEAHHERVSRTDRYARESGLDEINGDSSLNLTVNAGYVWSVNTRYYIVPVTSETRQFRCYHNSSGDWVISSVKGPKIDNTQYDDGYGLVEANDDRYLINYIYRGVENEDHVYTVYGNQEFGTLDEAKAAGIIGNLPSIITTHAVLIGRVIIQKNQTEIVAEDAFVQKFSGASSVVTHSALTGLDHDDHLQYAFLEGRVGGQVFVGGLDSTDDLILRTTTGNGTVGADMIFQTGDNGATEAMRILNNGNVGIGDVDAVNTLDVTGSICAKDVLDADCTGATAGNVYANNFIARTGATLPDYVFEKNYDLMSLENLRIYIDANKHLPGIASAGEVAQNGLDISRMVQGLLEKTEENTLYILQGDDKLKQLADSASGLSIKTDKNVTTISQLQDLVNVQFGAVEKGLTAITKNQDTTTKEISNINTQINVQTQNIASLQVLTDTLQQQIATLQSQIATPVNIAQIDANTQAVDYLNQLLGITPTSKAGDITIVGKLTSQITETGSLVINVSANPNSPTTGKDVIKTGDKKVVIKTEAVDADSNIFVTISKADKIVPIKAGNVTYGKSFEVEVDDVATSDVEFSWFIVNSL